MNKFNMTDVTETFFLEIKDEKYSIDLTAILMIDRLWKASLSDYQLLELCLEQETMKEKISQFLFDDDGDLINEKGEEEKIILLRFFILNFQDESNLVVIQDFDEDDYGLITSYEDHNENMAGTLLGTLNNEFVLNGIDTSNAENVDYWVDFFLSN